MTSIRELLQMECLREQREVTVLAPHLDVIAARMKYPVRLWMELEPKLYHVQLHEPLEISLRKSSTYTKSKMPRGAFEALTILREVNITSNIIPSPLITLPVQACLPSVTYTKVEREHLFPTLPMLQALESKLGKRVYDWSTLFRNINNNANEKSTSLSDYEDDSSLQSPDGKTFSLAKRASVLLAQQRSQKRNQNRTVSTNPDYELFLQQIRFREPNFISLNKVS